MRFKKHCPWLSSWPIALLLFVILTMGCSHGKFCLPRIDPTGERFFVHGDSPALASSTIVPPPATRFPPPGSPTIPPAPLATDPFAAAPGLAPASPTLPPVVGAPALPAGPNGVVMVPQAGVNVTPTQVVSPVGSEVVLITTVLSDSGETLVEKKVEWTVAAGGVGQFVSPGRRSPLDLMSMFRGLPKKVSNSYVVNSTVFHDMVLDRGTPSPADDIPIRSGQAWVSVSSPIEGMSVITAYAPSVEGWDRHQQTGTIYWIDAQWTFPPPAINPVGTQHAFTTTVTRQTDGSPLAGWDVRYEITGGPESGFAPSGGNIVVVKTDSNGQATAEIMQGSPAPGTNQIAIQVIRPAGLNGGPGREIVVGTGATQKTWTATDIGLDVTGPSQASVGSTVTYRLAVVNPATQPARDIVISDEAPAGMTFLNSNPAPEVVSGGQQWRLGDLGPRDSRVIEVNYRIEQPGSFNYCASVTAAAGVAAKDCVSTVVGAAGQLDVSVQGPTTAEVGGQATFNLDIVNNSDIVATGLLISDQFDAGLEHATASSPIERDLPDLPPRQSTRIAVTFRVAQPGQHCQEIVVTSTNGMRGEARHCLSATAPFGSGPAVAPAPVGPSPTPAQPSTSEPTTPQPSVPQPSTQPPARGRPSASGQLSVRLTGPNRLKINQMAEFKMEVKNNGQTPLTNVLISDNYETSLEAVQASDGMKIKGGALQETIASLEPNETIVREVHCRCVKEASRACNRVTVTADGGETAADEWCLEITSANPAAATQASNLTLTIADSDDPMRVGGQTTYQVTLANKGAGPALQVLVKMTVSAEMQFSGQPGSQVGSTRFPRTVQFNPIAEVRPGESLLFEMHATAERAGEGKLHVEAVSQQQRQPVVAEEKTQILE